MSRPYPRVADFRQKAHVSYLWWRKGPGQEHRGPGRAAGRYGPRNAAVSLQIIRGRVWMGKKQSMLLGPRYFRRQTKRGSRGSRRNRLRGIPAQIAELRPDLDRPGTGL